MNRRFIYFILIQVIAWSVVGGTNFIIQTSIGVVFKMKLLNALGLGAGGFIITTIYSIFLGRIKWQEWKRATLFLFIILSAIILTVIWSVMLYLFFGITLNKTLPLKILFINFIPISGLVLIWLLFYFSYKLIKHYHTSKVERWKLKADIQKAQIEILKLQINPHFLFNTLNNIRALILIDQQKARKMLTNFSDLFRYSLQITENREVKLSDELNIVRQYLELAKIQYDDKLAYNINVKVDDSQESIPPMLIQLMVENAVKHGVSNSESTIDAINIDIERFDKFLVLSVKNSGELNKSDDTGDSLGIGINNIKERLNHVYGNKGTFNLAYEGGYVIAKIIVEK